VSSACDGSLLFLLRRKGLGPHPQDFCTCWAHYRLLLRSDHGETLVRSTKASVTMTGPETIVERNDLDPKKFVLGEMEVPECVEFVVRRLGVEGFGVLRLSSSALPEGRPAGDINVEVELFGAEPACGGHGTAGWIGLKSVMTERRMAEEWLAGAVDARGKLEAFDKLKASEGQARRAALDVASAVRKASYLAERRFQRAKTWLEQGNFEEDPARVTKETARVFRGLAKAMLLNQKRFSVEEGEGQQDFGTDLLRYLNRKNHEGPPVGGPDKGIQAEARDLALRVLDVDATNVLNLEVAGFACAELGDFATARVHLEKALEFDPGNEAIKSEMARVNVREKHGAAENSETLLFDLQTQLDAAHVASDVAAVASLMTHIGALVDGNQVTWDACVRSKVGKTVGSIQKSPPNNDQEIQNQAVRLVRKFRDMAERNRPLWS